MSAISSGLKYEEKEAWNNFSLCQKEAKGINCYYLFFKERPEGGLGTQQSKPSRSIQTEKAGICKRSGQEGMPWGNN